MNNLTYNEKQSYMFGYLEGLIEGIHSGKFEGVVSEEGDKAWARLLDYSKKIYPIICEKMGIEQLIDPKFDGEVLELHKEISEIMIVYGGHRSK